MRQENWSVRKLRKLLDNKIAAVENVMREGLESASTDYCRFFEWKAAYLYKGELLRGHYRLLRNKVSRTDDVEDLKRYFGDIAMYHRERLAGGTPAGSGTHPMADTLPCAVAGMLAAGAERLHGVLAYPFPRTAGRGREKGKQTTRKT